MMWLKGSDPAECANAKAMRAKLPYLLEGTARTGQRCHHSAIDFDPSFFHFHIRIVFVRHETLLQIPRAVDHRDRGTVGSTGALGAHDRSATG